ncbi:class II fructose-1,6-bisphosphate aldolase [candidate division WOR-3 bacterium]|nr:class II fructose-1,6-bisphosphate aldolase [candidate division WOR-3 bacterium]
MIEFKSLGFVNTREMFKKAYDSGFAVPAYNFNNMEQLQSIMLACAETNSPVILQVSKGARKYANPIMLRYMAEGAVRMVRDELKAKFPIALHLDHGDSFETCQSAIQYGFSSVMIDGSSLSFKDNIELTKKVVEYAHNFDVTVEGELGVLAGIEDEVVGEATTYTDPKDVKEFVGKTNVDSLAISIGTSHGAYKFKLKPGEPLPELRFDILEEITKQIPGFPIVLHGSSSVPADYVDMINKYGGKLEGAAGVPEEQLRRAAKSSVCKINVDTDGRLVVTAKIREALAKNPDKYDPRDYLGPAREALKELLIDKNVNVMGSSGQG